MSNNGPILTSNRKDLFKIRATLVAVVEDMAEEIKDRMNDLEDAYFDGLGGSVISKVDTFTLVDTVLRDIIAVIETESAKAEKQADLEATFTPGVV